MLHKILIANRGEIALRVIRTLREMGKTSVAIFSDADRDALFVLEADEAYRVGPAPAADSYLNVEAILAIARQAQVDAIHPGYGFLAENAGFAQAIIDAGKEFIGPPPDAIRTMGDKVEARRLAGKLGVPVVPGTPGPVSDLQDALSFGSEAGYPIAVKAAGGGGGRGIRVVNAPGELEAALEGARREAQSYFKNPEIYLERYFHDPRHVEMQVIGDRHGHLVHLGERDCSVQRRHQKLIEETPSPAVDRELRAQMGEMAVRLASAVGYSSAGTVEFLLTRDGQFFFLEMNTRIQVEHPITESVTGVDLMREMILAAEGEHLSVCESVLDPNGHSIEIRINAEDPLAGFQPTATDINRYREPGGIGVRVDSGVYAGYSIPRDYDSLMAKLIVWAPEREGARLRALRALDEYRIEGPASTIPFAKAVLEHPIFIEGAAGTAFVGDHGAELEATMRGMTERTSLGPAVAGTTRGEERRFEVTVNQKLFHVSLAELHQEKSPRERSIRGKRSKTSPGTNAVLSPMHGTVIAIRKQVGEEVQEGEPLFIVEAMKMENEIPVHRSGTLVQMAVSVGQTVESGETLAVIS